MPFYFSILLLLAASMLLHCVLSAWNYVPKTRTPNRDLSRPVSDEEFMAACSVKDPAIALKVREILADCTGLDEDEIHPQDRLIYELGME